MSEHIPSPEHTEYNKIRMTSLYANGEARFKSTFDYAMLGLRSVLIANGGALIAMLAYLGNARMLPRDPGLMWWAFGLFTAGLVSSLLAVLAAYVSQGEFARQDTSNAEFIYFHSVGDPKNAAEQSTDADKSMRQGGIAEKIGIAFYVASVAAFVAGAITGVFALTTAA